MTGFAATAIDAVLFDLDGTLVDSVPDIAVAVDAVLAELGRPLAGEARVRDWVGNGAEMLVRRALSGDLAGVADARLAAHALTRFREHYRAGVCAHSRLYDGVLAGLAALRARGLPLGCVTNKPLALAQGLIDGIGLAPYLSVVVGGECVRPKPAPEPLQLAASRLGVAVERVLMVGDSRTDIAAARNAGCAVVCVPYGYNHGEDVRLHAPDAVIASIAELPALLAVAA